MPRTTLDIDAPILRDLKRMGKREGKSLGRLVSDLLAQAIARRDAHHAIPPAFEWTSRRMQARVDLADRDAVRAILDRS
jgi:hypothetical protein